MPEKSIASVLILSLIIGFGGVWVYMAGVERGTEVAGLSPAEYVARRQQFVGGSADDIEREQAIQPQTSDSSAPPLFRAPQVAMDEEGVSPVRQLCHTDWRNLAGERLVDLETAVAARQAPLSPKCARAMLEEEVTPVIENFILNCVAAIASIPSETLQSLCLEGLPQLKALATRRLGDEALTLDRPEENVLREQLVGAFVNLGSASEGELQQDLAIANRLIAEDPDSYVGYKAKLVGLLLNETKFENDVVMEEYMNLYDEMLRFGDETTGLPSAAEGIGAGLGAAPEIGDLDADLVHIPFLRLSALGQYQELENLATDYISAYPNSYIGYLYGAESLWRSGERAASIDTLRQVFPEQDSDEALYTLFEQYQRLTPVERIEQMGLGVR